MKKQILEPDFIGGQSPLTKEEEKAISKFLAEIKAKSMLGLKPTPKKSVTAD